MHIQRASLAACTACFAMAATLIVSGRQAPAPPAPADPLAQLQAPWPDAATIEARQREAEGRPLFASADVLTLRLTTDLRALQKDRNPDSTRRFPGTVTVTVGGSTGTPIPVTVNTRGRNRLKPTTCDFPPLRIRFDRTAAAGTVFDGQSSLKLVTHCRDTPEYAPYLQQEYVAYRVVTLHTPWSFRVRLARITYVDTGSGRTTSTHPALFIEDDDDVARRNRGRAVNIRRVPYAQLDQDATTRMALVQYLIANTDYGFLAPHNIAIMQAPGGRLVPVAYDFDMSGLVNTMYAGVNPKLGLASPRERLYRGPCRPTADMDRLVAEMRQQEAQVMALYDVSSGLERAYVRHARQLLGDFYDGLDKPDRLQKAFMNGCSKHLAR